MELLTPRMRLVPVEPAHIKTTYEYAADIDNTRFMMYLPFESMEETEASVIDAMNEWKKTEPARLEFAIIAEGKHIGGIILYFLEDRTNGELGWVVHKDHWGRGYVTEAARAMLVYAAERWRMKRIIACCDSENIASRRVMEKLGMTYCSTGKRKNRSSGDEERIELTYELYL